jgi:hypothetical protein
MKANRSCGRDAIACFKPKTRNGVTLRHLVRQYALHCRSRSRDELQFFVEQPSLEAAVEATALAVCRGKRLAHQRRRSCATLSAARDVLLSRVDELLCCRSFCELHETVDRLVAHIPDLGELYSYDTALFIGAKRGLMPDRVYLHAGTRVGARALGLSCRGRAIGLNSFSRVLHALAPHEIEDFLCIFKSQLHSAMV